MPGETNSRDSGSAILVGAVIVLIVILFLPLLASLCEHALFGSDHVEDFFRRIGLHGVLNEVYEPITRLFRE